MECAFRLYLCFLARSYQKATEHLNAIPEWEDAGQFSVLVVSEWSMWMSDLILNFQFVAAWRLLSNPLADAGGPLLAQLDSTSWFQVYALHWSYNGWFQSRMSTSVGRCGNGDCTLSNVCTASTSTGSPPVRSSPHLPKPPIITDFFAKPKRARVA